MKTIDALVEALENYVNGCSMSVNAAEVARAALAQARAEQAEPVSYADCQQRIGPPITFFTSIAAQAYRAAATRDDVSHEDAMRHALNEVQRARYATAPTPSAATVPVLEPLTDEQDRALCEAYCNTASDAAIEAAHAAKLAKRGAV